MPITPSTDRTDVFISFARQDEQWLARLRTMLGPLVRRGDIVTWDSTRLEPGSERFLHLDAAIRRARVAVLLVSPDYLADDSIATHELPQLLQAARDEGLIVLWIPVRHSLVKETELGKFESALKSKKPLRAMSGAQQDAALLEGCERINQAFEAVPTIEGERLGPSRSNPPTQRPNEGAPFTELRLHEGAREQLARDLTAPSAMLAQVQSESRTLAPRTVPALPVNYVKRTREFEDLVGYLLRKHTAHRDTREVGVRPRVAIATALHGAGGYGKTTLAQALCHDDRVLEAFSAGILWVTLGEHLTGSELVVKLLDIIVQLTGSRPPLLGIEAAANTLADHLADRVLLLVIDDVWYERDLEPFLRGGPRTTRLITTRNSRLLPEDCLQVTVDAMEEDHAKALLSANLPQAEAVKCSAILSELADKWLWRWPLLLGIVNQTLIERLKRGRELGGALQDVRTRLELRGLKAFDQDGAARHRLVARTVDTSLELLGEAGRARFGELAIFPVDMDVPLEAVARFWAHTGRLEALETEDLCLRLHGMSLLQRLDLEGRTFRLHDVVREYLRLQAGTELGQLHAEFLDAWQPTSGPWWKLPQVERYVWIHLREHLEGAGRGIEWHRLLGEYQWIQAKLEATDVNALIEDYAALPAGDPLRPVGDALRLASHVLAWEKEELASQLTGRLLGLDAPEIVALLEGVRQHERQSWLRPLWASFDGPEGPLQRTLAEHIGSVQAVAVLTDGRVISGGQFGELKVWDVETGRCLRTFGGNSFALNTLSVLPDGRVISGGYDRTLKVWDVEAGRCLLTLQGHWSIVTAVSELPDGRAISGSWDGTLKVWNVDTGHCLRTLQGDAAVTTLSVLPDKRVISGGHDLKLQVWEVETGRCVRTLYGPTEIIQTVCALPCGRVISGGMFGELKVWDVDTGRCLQTLTGHVGGIMAVCVLPDGQVVTSAQDGTLKMWEIQTGRCVDTLTGHTGWVKAVTALPDGRVVSGAADGNLKVWDIALDRGMRKLERHYRGVNAICALPDGRVLSGGLSGKLNVWELESGRCVRTLYGHSKRVSAVTVLPDGRAISGSWDGTLKVWEIKSGRCVRTLYGHSSDVLAVAALPNGRVISGATDHTLKVWDVETGRYLRTLMGHTDRVLTVTTLPDGRVISGGGAGELMVWEIESGRCVRTLNGHSTGVSAVAALPDGRAISGSWDGTLKVWNVETADCLFTLERPFGAVQAVNVLPGGRVISAGSDGKLRVWDVDAGSCVTSVYLDAPLNCCDSFADGTLVAGDHVGRVYAFRLEVPGVSVADPTQPVDTSALPDATLVPPVGLTPSNPSTIVVIVPYIAHDEDDLEWYGLGYEARRDRMRAVADRLVADGLEVVLHEIGPASFEGWPRWMEVQLDYADFVLVVFTETLMRTGGGEGAFRDRREVDIALLLNFDHIYATSDLNSKVIPILLEGNQPGNNPNPLQPCTWYAAHTTSGYEQLYRHLTAQPRPCPPR